MKLLLMETYRETRPVAGDEMEHTVAAFNAGLTAIFEQLSADLPNTRR